MRCSVLVIESPKNRPRSSRDWASWEWSALGRERWSVDGLDMTKTMPKRDAKLRTGHPCDHTRPPISCLPSNERPPNHWLMGCGNSPVCALETRYDQ
jgi:hypothetical protein